MKIRDRLIIAFLVLGLLAALSVGALSVYATRGLFAEYAGAQRAARLAQWRDIAAGYYEQTGSWGGFGAILAARSANASGGRWGMGGMGRGMGRFMGDPSAGAQTVSDSIVLADTSGTVVAGALPPGQQVPAGAFQAGLDIIVGGLPVGKMVDLNAPTALATADTQFIGAARRAILIGAIVVAVIAVTVGALMARRIAAPIGALTNAVSRGGDRPVPVSGNGEVRRLAEEFNAVLGRLNRNEQVRRTMVSDIAHELRTPLTVLSTHLENLSGRCSGETAQQVVSLQDEVLRMNRLVGDLQTLSLADAGALTLNRRRTDLRALLSRIVELTSPVAAERGVSVKFETGPAVDAAVDPDRMTQAVLNLVSNALRHTPAGGHVALALERTGSGAMLISVADTGPGIAPADLPLVFERFYRADPARSRLGGEGGSGLGLAIVRGIIEAHGGRVWAESEPGQGARFRIELPGAPD